LSSYFIFYNAYFPTHNFICGKGQKNGDTVDLFNYFFRKNQKAY